MDYQVLPVEKVKLSPMNPRKTIDEGAIAELAENIEAQGLIQPITVRPIAYTDEVIDGELISIPSVYEIVCGERRYRAFCRLNDKHKSGKFAQIPAIIRVMNDDEAFDAMITENLQRKDVEPLEEAFAFEQLIKKGNSVEEVALRFGKSIRFVQDRVKLNLLIPQLRLELKSGNMPLNCAMLIAKLDAEKQLKYYDTYKKQYTGFTKQNAMSFIEQEFRLLIGVLWEKYEDGKYKDFEGSCGCRCSECQFNSANESCLFHEFNNYKDGKCTRVDRFNAKRISFIEQVLKDKEAEFVKKGEPIVKGKTIIGVCKPNVADAKTKAEHQQILDICSKLNLEVVNPYKYFLHMSYGSEEQIQEKLEKGLVYRCLIIQDVTGPTLKYEYGFLRGDETVRTEDRGMPVQVENIIANQKYEENKLEYTIAYAGQKALADNKISVNSENPLQAYELEMLMAILLKYNHELLIKLCPDGILEDKSITDFVKINKSAFNWIVRSYLCQRLIEPQISHLLSEYIEQFASDVLPAEYDKAREVALKRYERNKAKAIAELASLGYDLNGEKLATEEKPKDFIEKYDEMKKKHPEAVILFRVGDSYQAYKDDAKKISEILGTSPIPQRKAAGVPEIPICGFPHYSLDTYLPKLIRSGVKVAICE